jgi:hypothetical protein
MLNQAKAQWALHQASAGETTLNTYFDHVIFSTNITYSDGTSNNGMLVCRDCPAETNA